MPSRSCWLLTWHSDGDEAAFFLSCLVVNSSASAHEKVGVALEARVLRDDGVHGGGKMIEIHERKNVEKAFSFIDTTGGAVPTAWVSRQASRQCLTATPSNNAASTARMNNCSRKVRDGIFASLQARGVARSFRAMNTVRSRRCQTLRALGVGCWLLLAGGPAFAGAEFSPAPPVWQREIDAAKLLKARWHWLRRKTRRNRKRGTADCRTSTGNSPRNTRRRLPCRRRRAIISRATTSLKPPCRTGKKQRGLILETARRPTVWGVPISKWGGRAAPTSSFNMPWTYNRTFPPTSLIWPTSSTCSGTI